MTLQSKKKYLLFVLAIILLDQISKLFIDLNFTIHQQKKILDGFFNIWYTQNTGAIWGIFSSLENPIISKIITGLSIIAVIIVIVYFLKIKPTCVLELTSLSFIIGGAFGNIFDRLFRGYVIDFLDFYINKYHWPTFNIADSFITIGVIILAISIWRGKCPVSPKNAEVKDVSHTG